MSNDQNGHLRSAALVVNGTRYSRAKEALKSKTPVAVISKTAKTDLSLQVLAIDRQFIVRTCHRSDVGESLAGRVHRPQLWLQV